jgi:leader peptidase (prepilin peptidase)/N-methyltransferase
MNLSSTDVITIAAVFLLAALAGFVLEKVCRSYGAARFARPLCLNALAGCAGLVAYLSVRLPCNTCSAQSDVLPAYCKLYEASGGLTVMQGLHILVLFLVLCLLGTLSLIDLATHEIPNMLNLCLLACGVLHILIAPSMNIASHLIGLVCISLPLGIIAFIAPHSFGMGDVKLMAAAGFLLGFEQVVLATVLAVLIGGLQGVYLLARGSKGRKEQFAFGPALCVGIAFALCTHTALYMQV